MDQHVRKDPILKIELAIQVVEHIINLRDKGYYVKHDKIVHSVLPDLYLASLKEKIDRLQGEKQHNLLFKTTAEAASADVDPHLQSDPQLIQSSSNPVVAVESVTIDNSLPYVVSSSTSSEGIPVPTLAESHPPNEGDSTSVTTAQNRKKRKNRHRKQSKKVILNIVFNPSQSIDTQQLTVDTQPSDLTVATPSERRATKEKEHKQRVSQWKQRRKDREKGARKGYYQYRYEFYFRRVINLYRPINERAKYVLHLLYTYYKQHREKFKDQQIFDQSINRYRDIYKPLSDSLYPPEQAYTEYPKPRSPKPTSKPKAINWSSSEEDTSPYYSPTDPDDYVYEHSD